jgi:FHA domain
MHVPGSDPGPGSGIPLKRLREDAQALGPEEFEDRHGSAFLLLSATDLSEPGGPASTVVEVIGLDEPTAERTASLSLLAYPVRRSGRSAGHLLTIGRASNNDVVIRDLSISRFHAFLKPAPGGRYQLQDANSTNGTSVNGVPVASQGAGSPADLKSGDSVRLGQVALTFLDAESLRQFALAQQR